MADGVRRTYSRPRTVRSKLGRWVRHDVARGLVEGASGLLVFPLDGELTLKTMRRTTSAYRTITPILCSTGELGQALLLGENTPAAIVDPSYGIKDLSIEAFRKIASVPAVGLRAKRHHDAVKVFWPIRLARRFQAL